VIYELSLLSFSDCPLYWPTCIQRLVIDLFFD
jgi:hypothetical protein